MFINDMVSSQLLDELISAIIWEYEDTKYRIKEITQWDDDGGCHIWAQPEDELVVNDTQARRDHTIEGVWCAMVGIAGWWIVCELVAGYALMNTGLS